MIKKRTSHPIPVIMLLAAFLAVGCAEKKTETGSSAATAMPVPRAEERQDKTQERKPVEVMVSTDLIREIMYVFANSRTKGRVLIANGTNPLAYVPTDQDKQEMLKAKIVFYMGLGLEPALENYLETIKDKVRVVALSAAFEKSELIPSKAYKGGYDPHFWWDPKLWEKAVLYTIKILDDYDAEYQYNYKSTYIRYGESLSHLYRYFNSWLGNLPENAVLLTLHPAYTYLGKAFNLKTMSLTAPGALKSDDNRLKETAAYIIEQKIGTIFPEYQFPVKEIEQVAAIVKQKGYTLNIGEAVYSYNLGLADAPEFTYLRAGRKLVDTIYTRLKAADAPEIPR